MLRLKTVFEKPDHVIQCVTQFVCSNDVGACRIEIVTYINKVPPSSAKFCCEMHSRSASRENFWFHLLNLNAQLFCNLGKFFRRECSIGLVEIVASNNESCLERATFHIGEELSLSVGSSAFWIIGAERTLGYARRIIHSETVAAARYRSLSRYGLVP